MWHIFPRQERNGHYKKQYNISNAAILQKNTLFYYQLQCSQKRILLTRFTIWLFNFFCWHIFDKRLKIKDLLVTGSGYYEGYDWREVSDNSCLAWLKELNLLSIIRDNRFRIVSTFFSLSIKGFSRFYLNVVCMTWKDLKENMIKALLFTPQFDTEIVCSIDQSRKFLRKSFLL